MKVYVAVRGCYEDQVVSGVYTSLEKAQQSQPGSVWTKHDFADGQFTHWTNDLDWDDYCVIEKMELVAAAEGEATV